jgi:4'-phosphopantetheinyl transferase EntD
MPRSPDHERVVTPHGTCILLAFADDDALAAALAALPPAERDHARSLSEVRRRELIAGRTALHLALDDFSHAILPDDRGAPVLPAGLSGSVSHKGAVAAAIVAPADGGFVGIDLERAVPPRRDIAARILTPREQAALPDRGRAVTLRFAIKEAIYKAIDPVVRRYVGFTEVELDLIDDGCAITTEIPLSIEAHWREHGEHWLATARARR